MKKDEIVELLTENKSKLDSDGYIQLDKSLKANIEVNNNLYTWIDGLQLVHGTLDIIVWLSGKDSVCIGGTEIANVEEKYYKSIIEELKRTLE